VVEHGLDAGLLPNVVRESDRTGGHDLLGARMLHRRNRFQLHLRVREDAPAIAGIGGEAGQRRDGGRQRVHLAAEVDAIGVVAEQDALVSDVGIDERVEADLRRPGVVILEQRLRVSEARDDDLAVLQPLGVVVQALPEALVDLGRILSRREDEVARAIRHRPVDNRPWRTVAGEDELALRVVAHDLGDGRPELVADAALGDAEFLAGRPDAAVDRDSFMKLRDRKIADVWQD
jgi:hypothetical protein